MRNGKRVVLALLVALCGGSTLAEEAAPSLEGVKFLVSPMAGVAENELTLHQGPPGTPTATETDTGPMYGLFAMVLHPNFIVNNFLFYSDVNDTDVWGDLFFANYYFSSKAPVTWNAGVGYLYHEIKPEGTDIEVKVPMVKTGPFLRIAKLHLVVNPWAGYAWESVDTNHGDQDNDSYLYGLTMAWRWRMMEASTQYYYQDSQKIEKDFHIFRGRFNFFLTKTTGISIRGDYMEHQFTKDKSILVGPIWMF